MPTLIYFESVFPIREADGTIRLVLHAPDRQEVPAEASSITCDDEAARKLRDALDRLLQAPGP